MLCLNGKGKINDTPIKVGETIFVPAHSGVLNIEGENLDLAVLSYKE